MNEEEHKLRHEMWMNFLWACNLGAVVLAADNRVWQKQGKFTWKRIGANREYSSDEIVWPVERLFAGFA